MTMRRILPVLMLCSLLTVPVVAGAPAVPKEDPNLREVLNKLKQEQDNLEQTRGEERSLLGDLERLDQKLAEARHRREELSERAGKSREEVRQAEKEIAEMRQRLSRNWRQLGMDLRLLQGLGSEGPLKIAFSQENATHMRQSLHYLGYLLQARKDRTRTHVEGLNRLRQSLSQQAAQLRELRTAEVDLKVEEERWKQRQAEREALFKQVRERRSLLDLHVAELKAARDRLSGLVDRLGEASDDAPALVRNASFGHITDHRGKLEPPVPGKGQARNPGWFFPLQNGVAVRAIFRGQVVFADWFRGFGLIVILNHGDQTFSLYGHNQRLLVAPGDWVEEGERVAETGNTGSLEGESGLYFEIRFNGEASNPPTWLAHLR
ncbi:MAG: peptidoglycan DD-metalloendopeptidase family protein [Magnetococcales bacterium]|nr:peptidoglycan DD-metalloendopeptidase family protein [Magnetococcales bacterium]